MSSADLDSQDYRILHLMQEDASRSIAELAEQAHISPNACWRRLKRLQEEGYITKRVALLDAAKLGVGLTAFVAVRAAEHTEEWFRAFAAAVAQISEVVEFYRMSGEADYLLKVQVADIAAFDAVYKRLSRSARLMDVSSTFAMEEIKRTTSIPIPGRFAPTPVRK